MNLHRLNDDGIRQLTGFLTTLKEDSRTPYPAGLLTDPACAQPVRPAITVVDRTLDTRYAAAQYLYHLFHDSGLTDLETDRGLMTIDEDYRVRVSPRLSTKDTATNELLHAYANTPIRLPSRFLPDPDLLAYHRSCVFDRGG